PGDPDSSGVVSGLGLHPVNANVYETLVRLTPDFRVAPQLATRWQLRLPNTWRFHLRRGVRMHDGTTLTAAAVVWTMRRIARAGGAPRTRRGRAPSPRRPRGRRVCSRRSPWPPLRSAVRKPCT